MHKIVLLAGLCFVLGACGVKPDQPEGKPGHPRTYPDITIDTSPRGGMSGVR